ncbi:rhodanese [Candidatus Poribacteria bacterium]|nr:rhodanese [Candidatus Poribacteria bacterium]
MLNSIQKALQALFNRNATPSVKGSVPRAAPSAEEAIIPFNPAEHAIQPQSLKRLIDNGHDIILLDVREAWEYEIVHLKDAKQISLGELPQQASLLNPYAEIAIYCHKGMRSLDAVYLLQQLGFKRVKSLVGGIDRWAREIDTELQRY